MPFPSHGSCPLRLTEHRAQCQQPTCARLMHELTLSTPLVFPGPCEVCSGGVHLPLCLPKPERLSRGSHHPAHWDRTSNRSWRCPTYPVPLFWGSSDHHPPGKFLPSHQARHRGIAPALVVSLDTRLTQGPTMLRSTTMSGDPGFTVSRAEQHHARKRWFDRTHDQLGGG